MNFFHFLKIRYPIILALFSQFLAFVIQFYLQKILKINYLAVNFLIIHVVISLMISQNFFKLPQWFFLISILFPIFIFLTFNYFQIPPFIFGVLFFIFLFTFSHTFRERVPLYLTNKLTMEALIQISQEKKITKFVDLGSGTGGVVRTLSANNIHSVGVETAPLLWLFSWTLSIILKAGHIRRKNIWQTDLSEFDFVYAFLSPAVMTRLYLKAKNEMKESSYLVSNSFQIEEVNPDEIWELADKRETKLYLYKIN